MPDDVNLLHDIIHSILWTATLLNQQLEFKRRDDPGHVNYWLNAKCADYDEIIQNRHSGFGVVEQPINHNSHLCVSFAIPSVQYYYSPQTTSITHHNPSAGSWNHACSTENTAISQSGGKIQCHHRVYVPSTHNQWIIVHSHSPVPSLGLHSAAATGNVGLVEYALCHGQPINSVLDGVLPLHAACAGGNVQVVKVLIDHGADVNAPRSVALFFYLLIGLIYHLMKSATKVLQWQGSRFLSTYCGHFRFHSPSFRCREWQLRCHYTFTFAWRACGSGGQARSHTWDACSPEWMDWMCQNLERLDIEKGPRP